MANVNGWFQQSPDTRRMVRTLDGTARAILSDRYRRIDNYEVAQTVLPIISEMQGARIESCELTDTRMYIKVVNERIQTEVVPGDIVQAGILISNSEVGMGSVSVKPLIYRLVCTNGMVADVGVGKRHVGRINESVDGDFGIFRDVTKLIAEFNCNLSAGLFLSVVSNLASFFKVIFFNGSANLTWILVSSGQAFFKIARVVWISSILLGIAG